MIDAIRSIVWTKDEDTGLLRMTPEGLYGLRKMLVDLEQLVDEVTSGGVAVKFLARVDLHVGTP